MNYYASDWFKLQIFEIFVKSSQSMLILCFLTSFLTTKGGIAKELLVFVLLYFIDGVFKCLQISMLLGHQMMKIQQIQRVDYL